MSIAPSKPEIIVVLGQTASGKSALAVKIALRLRSRQAKKLFGVKGAEIISADSRQVYRGMNLGTGKITKKEMAGVPHYLLDVASSIHPPAGGFTAAHYQKLGKRAIEKIHRKGKLPIICGGTGFYIDALLYDYALPDVKPNIKLRAKLNRQTAAMLFNKLEKLDPRRAKNIDRHNRRRLVRALEIILSTGKPVPSPEKTIRRDSKYEAFKIGIKLPPDKLKKFIERRLEKRMREGMITEVAKLHKKGLSWKRLDNFGLEYRYVSRCLRGLISEREMFEKLKTEIWRYARRQMTWFKKDSGIHWVKKYPTTRAWIEKFLFKEKPRR